MASSGSVPREFTSLDDKIFNLSRYDQPSGVDDAAYLFVGRATQHGPARGLDDEFVFEFPVYPVEFDGNKPSFVFFLDDIFNSVSMGPEPPALIFEVLGKRRLEHTSANLCYTITSTLNSKPVDV